MIHNKKVAGIIVMAGNSTRYGKGVNKNLEIVNGKPVILYSLETFDKNKYVDEIVVVVKESEIENIKEILNSHKFNKKIKIEIGGKERKESVYNGIKSINSDIVLVHDGARPLVKDSHIENLLLEMDKDKGTTIGVKSKDTIKVADDNGIVNNTVKRANTWIIQTPQCFDRNLLKQAHEENQSNEGITDDCMLLERLGYNIKIVEGDYSNIKITTSEDKNIVQELMNLD